MGTSQVLPREAYTIGWISPLEIEYTAALVMLDEEHASPEERPVADENIYGLGSIAGHNIVIASLPVMGNNAAATVVTQMRNTFPNVQYILLVGIGGGVPTTTDNGVIRLGDVVVSKPTNGHSGTIQYDHGKAQVGHFQRTGALAPPARLLLNAAGDLAAKSARMRKDPIAQHLKRFDTSHKKLKRYAFPGPAKDHLYEADYVHLDPKKSCNDCRCDPRRRVPRETFDVAEMETDDEPMVVVHRGTIASGELVIKNATLRDQLAQQYDIFCFEMEAAGALAGSNCLVIRGISDYCDSHKNNEWHGYAAAVAAAYARQLLFHVPSMATRAPASLPITSDEHIAKERQMILDWVTTANFASQLNDLRNIHHAGTGKWFLDSEKFQGWLQTPGQTFYCTGIPGAGKTMLMATVVDHLITCEGSNPGLAQVKSPLPEKLLNLYRSFYVRKTRPSLDGVIEVLQAVISRFDAVYIIVDALDECYSSQGDYRPFLIILLGLQQTTIANILVTSRYGNNIERYFGSAVRTEIRANTDDLNLYLDFHVMQLSAVVRRDSDLQQRIKQGVMKSVDGMFLLAKLLLDGLVDRTSRNAIIKRLGKLPDGENALAMAYREAIGRIQNQRQGFKDLALRVLLWLVHAKRPLKTRELQHALVIGGSASGVDPGDIEDVDDMVSVCAGLVTVDKESDIIRLVHYTAQEYLWDVKDDLFPNAEARTTQACLRYLSLDAFTHGSFDGLEKMEDVTRDYPFVQYAAQFWGEHAAATDFSTYKEASQELLGKSDKLDLLAQLMHLPGGFTLMEAEDSPKSTFDTSSQEEMSPGVSGLQIAALFNLKELIEAILDGGADINQADRNGWTALHRAASRNSESALTLLLDRGAYIDQQAVYGGTALHRAATNEYVAIVSQLLHRGVLCDLEDNYGGTALHRAAKGGHVEVARLLIMHGADVDKTYNVQILEDMKLDTIELMNQISKTHMSSWESREIKRNGLRRHYIGTAMHQAVRMGHDGVLQLLLESKADPFCVTKIYETPLHLAAETGNEHITQILLSTDATLLLNQISRTGMTPLSLAARNGHKGVVEILLNRPDIDMENGNPLREATLNGHCNIFDLIASKRLNVNAALGSDRCDDTPLDLSFRSGSIGIFQRMLNVGYIRLEDTNKAGCSSLELAARYGALPIFEFILERSPFDITRRHQDGRTLLSFAAEGGDTTIARLILDRDRTQLNALDNNFCSPLWWAACNAGVEMIDLLLETQGHMIAVDEISPLIKAASRGDEGIVAALLANNSINIRARDHHNATALNVATANKRERVVVMLLQAGCLQPGDRDEWRDTLSAAIRQSSQPMTEALLSLKWVDISSHDLINDDDLGSLCSEAHLWDSEITIRALGTSPGAMSRLRQNRLHQEVLHQLIHRLRSCDIELPGDAWMTPPPITANNPPAENSLYSLHDAIRLRRLDLAREALYQDPHCLDSVPSLCRNVAFSSVEILQFLLSQGLDPNACDKTGGRLLIEVVMEGRAEMLKLFMHCITFPTAVFLEMTALDWALSRQHGAVIKLLVNTGWFDLNSPNCNGETPLEVAIGSTEAVKILLATGQVIVSPVKVDQKTALSRAAAIGNLEIVGLLIADTTVTVEDMISGLQQAACAGHTAVVRLLIDTGKIDLQDPQRDWGDTVLKAAAQNHFYTVQTLLKYGVIFNAENMTKFRTEIPHKSAIRHIIETSLPKRKRQGSDPVEGFEGERDGEGKGRYRLRRR
ncbi:hypothetical protein FE257_008028 [Aspergillus nanangensis]|uniref:Nucleoside phosphorylase domain-containing protein n=1 Tax=Aspergillus nanangensis TaxID=2582783 RepID=A0AAD4CMA6_ASPNN|nr:hypothetical protein FE257_008028 [Aspergillus nanangensis]